ncbi:MAG TPA: PIN domain-containing protein [Thermoplasmata archaeon]|nr:PIN domain-containing protein [Thermoplasmata archaeon]
MVVLDSTFLVDLSRSVPSAVRVLQGLVARGRPLRVPTSVLMEVAAGTPNPEDAAREIGESFLVENFDEQIATIAAKVGHEALRTGRFPGWIDIIIAATALRFGEELLSRNERHFRRVRDLQTITY